MLHPEGMVVPLSTAFLWTSICVPGTTGHLYCILNKRERFVAKPSVYLTNREYGLSVIYSEELLIFFY